MSLMCDNGGLFCPFEGCASSCLGTSDVTQRPYHRNCKCSLHDAAGGSNGVGGKLRRSNSRVKISSMKQGACGDHHQQLVLSNGGRAASFSDLASANAGGLGLNKSSSFSDLAVMSPPFMTDNCFSNIQ